ncbi:unnamed protein product [Blepharisma stoltei]|uniref:Uncharacterized protein n=1 Tax=Blepharisma stoltei TaxID=1481888 RepID=A0AAU9KH98_9CILI|nr:unnamed protein product [Blepharisma stoltei]
MCKSNFYNWNKNVCFWINAILFSCYVLGICVWAGIFFIIYYPLIKRDYKEAPCTITGKTTFTLSATSSWTYHSYSLDVYINNTKYKAYGCISNSAETSISTTVISFYYPYNYIPCKSDGYVAPLENCLDDQIFLPFWTCKNASDAYLAIGSSFTCKWWLADKDGETDPAKSESITYPGYDNSWVEVLFKDDIFIPTDDYNTLWGIPFALLICAPLIIIIWINCGIFCCGYSEEFKLVFNYWYTKYIKCKIAKKPIKHCDEQVNIDKTISTIAFLMALTKGKHAPKFPKSLIKKTVNYL